MKNTILGILAAACLLIAQGPVLAQVYHWQGNTSSWNDPANWLVDGNRTSTAPSQGDHVMFSSAADAVDITFDEDATIASLTVADDRQFRFSATRGAQLTVSGHFNLNASSQVGNNLTVSLVAEPGSGATYAAAESNLSSIVFAEKAAYTRLQPFGENRASCGFFTIVPEVTNPTCNGDSDGIVAVEEPTDGTGPYTYQWIGGPAEREWIGVGAGTYTVIVIDVGGGGVPCSEDIFVNEPGPLTLFAMNGVAPICFGDCNGSAAPIVIGGNGGYELTWSSGETGFMPEQLCASFTLEVEDQLGCEFTTDFDFPDAPDPVTVTGSVTDVFCAGDDDGAISTVVTGGDGSYTLNWTGPGGFTASVTDINNLVPGTYTLMATDGSGCEGVGSFVVNEVEQLDATAVIADNLCPDGTEGEIALTVTGGTSPFTFSWTGPGGYTGNMQTISDLSSGVYNLTLTDENNCVFTHTYTVNPPDDITVSAIISDADCFGIATASIDAEAAGGTPPFIYAWSGPDGFTASGGVISDLDPGTYELIVLDNNSCEYIESFEVTSPPEIEVTLASQPISCVGNGDGQITASATGGVAPYEFAWTGPGGYTSADQNISGLEPGSYTLLLTDANGCTVTLSETVPDAAPVTITGTVANTSCSTGNTGAIEIEVEGGVAPFIFAWTGPGGYVSSDQNISGLAPGTYNVVVTDAGGCQDTDEFTVQAPEALTANFDIEPVTCFGGTDASINTTPIGGTAPYTYFWIGPAGFSSSNQNIENLVAGTYTLLISDANGCNGFLEAVVTQSTQINITRVITNVTCFGGSNGAINISVSGGTPGYTFAWTGPNGFTAITEDVSGLQAGTYSVTATDVNGCAASRNYTINQPAEITFNSSVTNVVCAGDNDGAVNIIIATGAGPFTYSWSGPSGFTATTQSISGLTAGTYNITATNSQGCQGNAEFIVDE
ncbi:MAG: SprB repeat-containing protein, partial [Flavobacteriales bacterium]|nr:SprB repeat-containing protein [Flavobacteriales bacterium]